MFNVKVHDYNIQFTFKHHRDIGSAVNVSDITECTLIVNRMSFLGISACSTADNFNKQIGRKIALKRALEECRKHMEIPYEVRMLVWWRYHERDIPNGEWEHVVVYGTGKEEVRATSEASNRIGSDDLVNMA